MGCDVHPVIQVKNRPDSGLFAWTDVAIPDRDRCYALFSALAGVRGEPGDPEPVKKPRGLPVDYSGTKFPDEDKFLSHEHTPSWLSLREMEEYNADWLRAAYPTTEWPFTQWERWLKTMRFFRELYDVSPDAVRVVFDFDS